MSRPSQVLVAFRVVILLNLAATVISLSLTFTSFSHLAMELTLVHLNFLRSRLVTFETVTQAVQLLLQSPSAALCILLVGSFTFWQRTRALLLVLAPIVSIIEFVALAQGTTYLQVAFAPVPLLTTALLFLVLFNPTVQKRFSSREREQSEVVGGS